jgi:preprotein translocase subunit SecF
VFNIIGKRSWYFLFSTLILIPGIIALALWGLNLGIDFTGGSLLEVRVNREVTPGQVRDAVRAQGYPEASVVTVGETAATPSFLIRMRAVDTPEKNALLTGLGQTFGSVQEDRFEAVGPVVGGETAIKALQAVGVASLLILAYLWWAFRQVPKPWRYGLCAVFALVHDSLLVLGIWAILGRFLGTEVDSLFVTAMLTVVGFSVNDTIVVFDRVRENVSRFPGESFERVVNFSLNQTLDRSLVTGLSAMFALVALLMLGGGTLRNFVMALLVGLISGTYSSIFNASCLLVAWENGDFQRLWRRLTGRGAALQPQAA